MSASLQKLQFPKWRASNRLMHCNMIADFFSVLRLIFKHKQKERLAAVFLFPSRRQCIKVGISDQRPISDRIGSHGLHL